MAQGDILYRAAAAWKRLAAGSAGQFLKTNGAGADPSWDTPSGSGTVTNTGTLTSGQIIKGNGGADITVGDLSGAITTSGSLVTSVGTIPGRLIGVQVITATGSGTYTPTAGTTSVVVELQGAGGGGGGCVQAGGSNNASGEGGSGGAYVRVRLTANFSGASYVVGAKGTGGSAGNNAGNNGTDTTFTDTAMSPTTYTAGKGLGGTGGGATTAPRAGVPTNGGTATNGDVQMGGGSSPPSMWLSSTSIFTGAGGSSFYGFGGKPARVSGSNVSAAGVAASGYGAGGSGAGSNGTGTAQAGGDGTDGLIVFWEYS